MANRQMGVNEGAAQFALEGISTHCGWFELLRELVQNGIDAGAKVVEVGAIAPEDLAGSDAKAPKLFVLDNGSGFDRDNMVSYLGDLFSSGREQSMYGNFGLGAKAVLFRTSPYGADYWTKPAGSDTVFHARLGMDAGYGLLDLDGSGTLVAEVTDPNLVPAPLRKQASGTMVVIHGDSAGMDTTANPGQLAGGRSWVSRALNRRYFQLPEGVKLRASVEDVFGKVKPMTVKTGIEVLTSASPASHTGCEKVEFLNHGYKTKAKVTWYLLHPAAKQNDSHGREDHAPIFAQLFNGECYNGMFKVSARRALTHFGITYAAPRVALYVEVEGHTPDFDRRHLSGDGGQLDLAALGHAFQRQMPEKLVKAETEHRRQHIQSGGNGKWRSRLKGLLDQLTLLRLDKTSSTMMAASRNGTVDRPHKHGDESVHNTSAKNLAPESASNRHGTSGGTSRGHATRPREAALPRVRWVAAHEMDDESFIVQWVPTTEEILINSAHAQVKEALGYWESKVLPTVEAKELIGGEVRDLWDTQMIEKVINARSVDLDDEAVTALVSSVVTDRLVTDFVLSKSIDRKLHAVSWK